MPKSFIQRLLDTLKSEEDAVNNIYKTDPANYFDDDAMQALEAELVTSYQKPLAVESSYGTIDATLHKLTVDQKILRAKLADVTEELRQVDVAIIAWTAARDVLVPELTPVATDNVIQIANT